MVKTGTYKIDISVKSAYYPQHSAPKESQYFFVYYITIQNNSLFPVKLLKRHWDIVDSNGQKRVVEGDGVVGENPELLPGESFSYNSGCNLVTDIGYMSGFYTMLNLDDDSTFTAEIPRIDLVVPAKLN